MEYKGPMPPPPPRPRGSAANDFIDTAALSEALRPWLPDDAERAFVLRCVLQEGPTHHRGANFVLLSLLTELTRRLGVTSKPVGAERPFRMRLPPHLEAEVTDANWPIGVPEAALARLAPAGSKASDAMVDCVTDGPPQHSVANVLMLHLLNAALDRTP